MRRARRFALDLLISGYLVGGVAVEQAWWPPEPLPGYNIFNEQQEVWLGEVFAEEIRFDTGVLQDQEAQAYLQQLGESLARKSKRPQFKYEFIVLDEDEVQASALPGGRVYVTRGMIVFCENEAELAAVLGHEIAHIALRQGAKTFSRWLFWGLGVDKVGDKEDIRKKYEEFHSHLAATGGFQPPADLMFGITRADEVWADKYGIWNAHAAGYDPRAAVSVFRRFDEMEKKEKPAEEDQDPWLDLLKLLFSSHPPSGDRANLLKLEIPWMNKSANPVEDSKEFRRIRARLKGEGWRGTSRKKLWKSGRRGLPKGGGGGSIGVATP